jgi:hypothetical protein
MMEQPHLSLCAAEPSQIGASLLSAIKSKNAPCCGGELDDTNYVLTAAKTPVGASEVRLTMMCSNSSRMTVQGHAHAAGNDDVLQCSSMGLREKHISSFDHATRSPSTIFMCRMILERDCSASVLTADSSSNPDHHPPASSSHHHSTLLPQQGLSMRIEMELVNGSTTSTHPHLHMPSSLSLSSSFTRSISLSTIDDRIRRGLRKRVA